MVRRPSGTGVTVIERGGNVTCASPSGSACSRLAAGVSCNRAPLHARFLVCGVHGLGPAAMVHAASTVTGAWKVNMFNPKARFFTVQELP
jgi:hypothetical protein